LSSLSMSTRSENIAHTTAAELEVSGARFMNSDRIGSLKVWSFAIAEARQGGARHPAAPRQSLAVQGCCGLWRASICAC
jgi:hypothetical protein